MLLLINLLQELEKENGLFIEFGTNCFRNQLFYMVYIADPKQV